MFMETANTNTYMLMEVSWSILKYIENWKEFLKVFNFGEEKCLNFRMRYVTDSGSHCSAQ